MRIAPLKHSSSGAWLIAAGAGLALLASVHNDVVRSSGIAHSYGALAVVISSALVLVGALALTLLFSPRWLRGIILGLLMLGIVGTGCAAYFLEADVLLALMVLTLFGWIVRVFSGPGGPSSNFGSRAGALGRS